MDEEVFKMYILACELAFNEVRQGGSVHYWRVIEYIDHKITNSRYGIPPVSQEDKQKAVDYFMLYFHGRKRNQWDEYKRIK